MIPKDKRRVILFEMRLNFQNNRHKDSARHIRQGARHPGGDGGDTAESRYLIFKTHLFKLQSNLGYTNLSCTKSWIIRFFLLGPGEIPFNSIH